MRGKPAVPITVHLIDAEVVRRKQWRHGKMFYEKGTLQVIPDGLRDLPQMYYTTPRNRNITPTSMLIVFQVSNVDASNVDA